MSNNKYLGMRDGDLEGKPYAKYWNPEMKPVPPHVQEALIHGVEAAELGFEVTEANCLLEPGYLPLETGFTRLESGQVFVSTLTKMTGVTAEMIDWWFGWHSMETERYKLWHPRAHLSARSEKMNGDDAGLSDRDKYLDNPNHITEYVGAESSDIIITFSEASDFLDTSGFADAGVGTAICGTIGYQDKPVNFGLLIHMIRETSDGCEMRSRFWLGDIRVTWFPEKGIVNRIAASKMFLEKALPLSAGRDLLVHCAKEMNHLASFLPALYKDYH